MADRSYDEMVAAAPRQKDREVVEALQAACGDGWVATRDPTTRVFRVVCRDGRAAEFTDEDIAKHDRDSFESLVAGRLG